MNTSPFASQSFWVEGISAVAEYIKWNPNLIEEIQCIPKEQKAVLSLLAQAKCKIAVTVKAPQDPGQEKRPHQKLDGRPRQRGPGDMGFVSRAPVSAKVRLAALPVQDWLSKISKKPERLVVALDHVQDPRNLGAITRTVGFFGLKSVLVPERRQVLLTQASVATAQGGFALVDLVCAVNLSRALKQLKDLGYWIIGAAMDGERPEKFAGEYEKVVLVLGAEDTGLSRSVSDLCDLKVGIRGAGQLDSLNVSVAAGILVNSFVNSHLGP